MELEGGFRHAEIASTQRHAEQSGNQLAIRFSYFYRDFAQIAHGSMDEYLYCRHLLRRYTLPALMMEGDGFPVPAILTLFYFHQTDIRSLHLIPPLCGYNIRCHQPFFIDGVPLYLFRLFYQQFSSATIFSEIYKTAFCLSSTPSFLPTPL